MINKEGWDRKKLGDICETTSGGTPNRSNRGYYEGTIPWVKSGELDKGLILDTEEKITVEALKNSSAKLFPKGTLLIALYGATIGKLAFLGVEACTNQAICGIFKNDKIDSEFLYYFLLYKKPSLINKGVGVGQPNISQSILKDLEIPVPSIIIQQQIVSELDVLSNIITKKKEQLVDLDKLAQATFYDMFGDPVNNEKGWKVKKLGDLGNFKNGLNYTNSETGISIKILSVSNFKSNIILRNLEQLGYVGLDSEPNEDYYLKEKDIVFVRSNGSKELVGRSLLMGQIQEKITFSGFCIRFRLEINEIIPLFLIYILTNEHFKKNLIEQGRGANINNVNQQMLSGKVIILPPISIQSNFIGKIESIEKQKELINKSIDDVQQLFNYTMDKYFN